MINLTQMIFKTGANYIAFKVAKSTVDGFIDCNSNTYQSGRCVHCNFCQKIWYDNPDRCPHCKSNSLKKLYRDYEHKKDNSLFNIDPQLLVGKK